MHRRHLIAALLPACCLAPAALRAAPAVEWHQRLRAGDDDRPAPVALFVTRRWLDRNTEATRELLARPDLFELEDHGTAHVPAIVAGPDSPRRLYGMAARLRGVKPGDIVIAHMNHPGRGTAAGFASALPGLLARGLRFGTLSQAELLRVP